MAPSARVFVKNNNYIPSRDLIIRPGRTSVVRSKLRTYSVLAALYRTSLMVGAVLILVLGTAYAAVNLATYGATYASIAPVQTDLVQAIVMVGVPVGLLLIGFILRAAHRRVEASISDTTLSGASLRKLVEADLTRVEDSKLYAAAEAAERWTDLEHRRAELHDLHTLTPEQKAELKAAARDADYYADLAAKLVHG